MSPFLAVTQRPNTRPPPTPTPFPPVPPTVHPPPAGPFPLQFYLDPKPLLKLIFTKFLGSASGFVDVVAKHIPSPVANAQKKARKRVQYAVRYDIKQHRCISVFLCSVLCIYRKACRTTHHHHHHHHHHQ